MCILHYDDLSIQVTKKVFLDIVDKISRKYPIYKRDFHNDHIQYTFYEYYTDFDNCYASIGHMEEKIIENKQNATTKYH